MPSEQIANSIIDLLRGTPLAADERELARFIRLPLREQFAVAVLVKAGEAETVQGAFYSRADREETHTRALESRSRFGVVGDL